MKYIKLKLITMLIIGIIIGCIVGIQYTKKTSIMNADKYLKDKISIPIVAAADDIGMIGNVTLNTVSGTGRILFEGNPSIDTDMQYSMIIAIAYAEEYTNKKLDNKDLIIDFDMSLDVLGGVSAGAPITIATIALLENKQINQSIIITGTINPDGTIGRVGEIREKATAAKDAGYKIILVPSGQSRMWRQNYTLQEYLNNTIIIKEISNIAQAAKIMIVN